MLSKSCKESIPYSFLKGVMGVSGLVSISLPWPSPSLDKRNWPFVCPRQWPVQARCLSYFGLGDCYVATMLKADGPPQGAVCWSSALRLVFCPFPSPRPRLTIARWIGEHVATLPTLISTLLPAQPDDVLEFDGPGVLCANGSTSAGCRRSCVVEPAWPL